MRDQGFPGGARLTSDEMANLFMGMGTPDPRGDLEIPKIPSMAEHAAGKVQAAGVRAATGG